MTFDPRTGMEAAMDAARRGLEAGEVPIGAAVVMNDEVVSARHTEEVKQRRRLVHADVLALDDADRLMPSIAARAGATLFVTLEPCLLCMGAAAVFGAGEVHFALESPTDGGSEALAVWAARVGTLDGYSIPVVASGLMRRESLDLLRAFADSRSGGGLWRWTRATLDSLEA